MKNFFTMLFVFTVLFFPAVSSAEENHDEYAGVEIKSELVAGKVSMLTGKGGNIAVSVGEDGVLLVDDQFEPLGDKIKAELTKIGGSEKPKFIINTHWHFDHTDGNKVFGKDGTIIAHTNVRASLMEDQEVKALEKVVPALPKDALPVITFDDSLSVHFNGEEIQVMHFPNGHTDGDSVIFFTDSKVVHMGDHFFNGIYPFIDVEHGGDVIGLIENVEEVLYQIEEDVKIIPGHGPLATRADLEAYLDFLVMATDTVQEGIDSGKTLADIQKAGFPEEYASWSKGFLSTEKFIGIVYNSLNMDFVGEE